MCTYTLDLGPMPLTWPKAPPNIDPALVVLNLQKDPSLPFLQINVNLGIFMQNNQIDEVH
jgi:hypothetical protein